MNINATILGQTISFILFVIFCMKFVWPPIIGAIEKRQKEIDESLISVKNAKKNADLALTSANDHLQQAKEEARSIIAQVNKHRMQILEKAKIEANNERTRIIASAQNEINLKRDIVCEELRKQFASLVISGVEKIVERSIDANINKDIIDKLIADLK
ncbi:F0F1 ATP synthase subunit B [Candidatus Pantoea edessiphila]|uniref:ATP synthase subunit b n=1 Tax=Candidatus Pantoea edessiphila TaxID=2044610 RepID=A0A2P5SZB0_9GAMM|nr:F0F1 ATP synthase subunit B [Candidatus Pantoea edessiphila]PPI87643.1 F0F1 ATP synthase subunit B [Candidatus Pantoea edessiphila]